MAPRGSALALPKRALGLLLLALVLLAGCGGAVRSHGSTRAAVPLNRATHPDGAGPPNGAASLARRFDGVPQRGIALGSARAPFTLVEFADLQCPFCAHFDRDVLPGVIQRFVRTGRLRLELRPIVLIGPQSGPSGAATLAAAQQDHAWQFADLFYRNQGRENSGYVTWPFVARIAAGVPGLDPARLRRDLPSPPVRAALVSNNRSATTARITGTPGFRLGRTGSVLQPFTNALDPSDFLRRLDAGLRGA